MMSTTTVVSTKEISLKCLETALAADRAGLSVLPPSEDGLKKPYCGSWAEFHEFDDHGNAKRRLSADDLREYYSQGHTGIGFVCGKASGNLEVLDFDDGPVYERYHKAANACGLGDLLERIEAACSEETPAGGRHVPYFCSPPLGSTKLAKRPGAPDEYGNPTFKTLIETRGEGGYIVSAPSNGKVHQTGKPYRQLRGSVEIIATITPGEREALHDLARSFDEVKKASADVAQRQVSSEINNGSKPGADFNQRAKWADIMEPHGWRLVYEDNGVGHWRRPGKDFGISATTNFDGSGYLYVFSTSTRFDSERAYSKFAAYAKLNHNDDFHAAAKALAADGYGDQETRSSQSPFASDCSITTTGASVPWPNALDKAAFYGLAGDIAHAIEPHTEADPAALLLNTLAYFGNAVGRTIHTVVEADEHYLNINLALVGKTAKGRKGTSGGRIRDVFKRADPEWAARNIASGLSSGEGLIWSVRDKIEKVEAEREKGKPTGKYVNVVLDPGVEDKRLLVVEGELASVLKIMTREGNTLSPLIRLAWDTGDLRSLTKNSPAQATAAHISIVGHITQDELLRYLNDTEAGNGFANRFLWVCTERSKVLPEGGGLADYGSLIPRLRGSLETARGLGELRRDDEAKAIWCEVYPKLSEGRPGLLGSVTARAEAQVLRLSALYAAIDGSALIRASHLLAALAIWDYCEASARHIFGDGTGDPVVDRILNALRNNPQGLDRTEISGIFRRNVEAARIDQALRLLLGARLARFERVTPDEGTGRQREIWYPK